ncbi:glycosyltransferase [Lentzea sp. NEAU-D7]|uniref:glycosyltransferase n=1 Tax=Lentzea sp. NEAU-D7 TaxID=2994667 RepID=UPI00224B9D9F|nr:glycosyltransferase [Lentzea sp. NEAU-D7]MCX2953969.1 glycosyltransferase [Lentzea sp. NEAU-D7]
MRIAMVSLQASPLPALRDRDVTGQPLYVAKLSEALHQQGHELTIYTRRADARLPERMRVADGFEVVHLPAGPARQLGRDDVVQHIGEFAQSLHEHWTGDAPDLVHAHHWTSGFAAVVSTRHSGIPVVQSYHALLGGDSAAHERVVGREAARVIATSGHEADELAGLGVRRSKISTVPWGVDLRTFTPNGPTAPRKGMSRLLAVGGLAPHDGVDDLISALATVTWAELVVAGGPSRSRPAPDANLRRLRELASRHGVAHRVTFLGRVPHAEMASLMRSADVVVCPQWHEPFGIVPIEAMACGVPVVATAVGGLAETVVHGVTGVHVPPREPTALARALRSLLANDVRRQEMSYAAEDRARVRYAWQRVALEMSRAYQRAGAPVATGAEVAAAAR